MPRPELERLKRKMTRDDLVHLALQCAEEDGIDVAKKQALQEWLDEQLVPFLRAKLNEP